MLSFGPYETLSRIAAGGMGEVFVARRTGAGAFEKKVALKVLLPHLAHDREFVERFFDEARLVARMNHPNIVQIFDVGETDGRPWLAMALVEAVSLQRLELDLAAKRERMPLPLVRLIATGLLEGLSYAHALKGPKGERLGVVHRDITPSNLLVSTDGAVLLTDFGIAKASINMHRTQPGHLRGKIAYLAPENFSSDPVDQRSDLFSAGVTLYQLLTGASPFLRPNDTETIDAVKKAQASPVRALRGDVTPGLASALHRSLERQASARFATAKEMREAVCDGPTASAPELGEFVRRWCGRHLGAFTEAVGVTPATAEGGGTSSLPGSVTAPRNRLSLPWVAGAFSATVVGLGFGWAMLRPAEPPPTPEQPIARVEPVVVVPPAPQVEVALAPPEPVAPPVPSASPVPVRSRPKPQPPRNTGPPTVAPVRVGFLTADAAPWADVLLDGKVLDRTPLSRFPVPSGAHTLTFKASDGRKIERPVKIEEGEVKVVRVDFAAEK